MASFYYFFSLVYFYFILFWFFAVSLTQIKEGQLLNDISSQATNIAGMVILILISFHFTLAAAYTVISQIILSLLGG
jgi:hypothetical protein